MDTFAYITLLGRWILMDTDHLRTSKLHPAIIMSDVLPTSRGILRRKTWYLQVTGENQNTVVASVAGDCLPHTGWASPSLQEILGQVPRAQHIFSHWS